MRWRTGAGEKRKRRSATTCVHPRSIQEKHHLRGLQCVTPPIPIFEFFAIGLYQLGPLLWSNVPLGFLGIVFHSPFPRSPLASGTPPFARFCTDACITCIGRFDTFCGPNCANLKSGTHYNYSAEFILRPSSLALFPPLRLLSTPFDAPKSSRREQTTSTSLYEWQCHSRRILVHTSKI
ncbi:hypothetical protein DL96DRAFT_786330 [Flagelloscypha sp. PMI_526]|nr:hypothetical protein DL96DRAFT_786330 [Flagelloscypha sp. PMI_526]